LVLFQAIPNVPTGLSASPAWPAGSLRKALFPQVLERNLNAFVIELLIVTAKLIAPIARAMEELTNHSNGSVWLTVEPGCAPNVD
jgi:hypothetical protein